MLVWVWLLDLQCLMLCGIPVQVLEAPLEGNVQDVVGAVWVWEFPGFRKKNLRNSSGCPLPAFSAPPLCPRNHVQTRDCPDSGFQQTDPEPPPPPPPPPCSQHYKGDRVRGQFPLATRSDGEFLEKKAANCRCLSCNLKRKLIFLLL